MSVSGSTDERVLCTHDRVALSLKTEGILPGAMT